MKEWLWLPPKYSPTRGDTCWLPDWSGQAFGRSSSSGWEHFLPYSCLPIAFQSLGAEWSRPLLSWAPWWLVSDHSSRLVNCWWILLVSSTVVLYIFVCLFKWTFGHEVWGKIRRCCHNPELHMHCCQSNRRDVHGFTCSLYSKLVVENCVLMYPFSLFLI